jgi:hypothetical protein
MRIVIDTDTKQLTEELDDRLRVIDGVRSFFALHKARASDLGELSRVSTRAGP